MASVVVECISTQQKPEKPASIICRKHIAILLLAIIQSKAYEEEVKQLKNTKKQEFHLKRNRERDRSERR